MSGAVATIEISRDVLARIDEAIAPKDRIDFIDQAAEAALRNRRLGAFLDDMKKNGPAWKEEDHPELADGVYAYVRKIRAEFARARGV